MVSRNCVKALFVSLSTFTILLSCGTAETFRMTDANTQINSGKIAVISGLSKEANTGLATIELAKEITAELEKKSVMKVMSQHTIKNLVPDYPFTFVQENFESEGKTGTEYISENMRNATDQFNTKLKSDYILIVWINEIGAKGYGPLGLAGNMWLSVYTRLMEYPSGKVVGYYDFYASSGTGAAGDLEKAAANAIKEGAKHFADEFTAKTKMSKVATK